MGQNNELLTLREVVFELQTLTTLLYGKDDATGLVEELVELSVQLKALSQIIKADTESFRVAHLREMDEVKASLTQIRNDMRSMKELGSAKEWVKNVRGEIAMQLAEDPSFMEMLALRNPAEHGPMSKQMQTAKDYTQIPHRISVSLDTSKPALILYVFAILGASDLLARLWSIF